MPKTEMRLQKLETEDAIRHKILVRKIRTFGGIGLAIFCALFMILNPDKSTEALVGIAAGLGIGDFSEIKKKVTGK